jgi:hypothetical protein
MIDLSKFDISNNQKIKINKVFDYVDEIIDIQHDTAMGAKKMKKIMTVTYKYNGQICKSSVSAYDNGKPK